MTEGTKDILDQVLEQDAAEQDDVAVASSDAETNSGSTQDDKANKSTDILDEAIAAEEDETDEGAESAESDDTEALKALNAKIDAAVEGATREGDKIVFPKGTPVSVKAAARERIALRDTQRALTKEKTTNETLRETVINSADIEQYLTDEQKAELKELETKDKYAWSDKVNEYKLQIKDKLQKDISEAAEAKEQEKRTASARQAYLEYQGRNTDMDIPVNNFNDWVKENLSPAQIKRYTSGELTVEQFFDICRQVHTGKINIAKPKKATKQVNLGEAPGGHQPTNRPNVNGSGVSTTTEFSF